jgi:hypothetical protein
VAAFVDRQVNVTVSPDVIVVRSALRLTVGGSGGGDGDGAAATGGGADTDLWHPDNATENNTMTMVGMMRIRILPSKFCYFVSTQDVPFMQTRCDECGVFLLDGVEDNTAVLVRVCLNRPRTDVREFHYIRSCRYAFLSLFLRCTTQRVTGFRL